MADYKEFLQSKYNEIWDSSKEVILSNNIDIDSYLSNIKNDKRMGLTILIPITGTCLNNFVQVINQLKEIEPEQYHYPQTDIHITVIDFIGASEDFVLDEGKVKVYKEISDKLLKTFSRFNIEFKGLTASKGSIMVQGFFDEALQKMREELREEVNKRGIELKERYKVGTAHSTIMRFKQKLQNPKVLVDKVEELRDFDFGTFEVGKILFVLHDWYNLKEKTTVFAEYEL